MNEATRTAIHDLTQFGVAEGIWRDITSDRTMPSRQVEVVFGPNRMRLSLTSVYNKPGRIGIGVASRRSRCGQVYHANAVQSITVAVTRGLPAILADIKRKVILSQEYIDDDTRLRERVESDDIGQTNTESMRARLEEVGVILPGHLQRSHEGEGYHMRGKGSVRLGVKYAGYSNRVRIETEVTPEQLRVILSYLTTEDGE